MRRLLFPLLVFVLCAPVRAQAPNPPDIKGHFIGETVNDFLSSEPDAQQEVDVCHEGATGATCSRLLAALNGNGRAEITTSDGADFVLDGGRLVKVTILVQTDVGQTVAALTLRFGPANDKTFSNQNSFGAKWDNHLLSWSNAILYASLYEDNNPTLQSRLPVLKMETAAEHQLDDQAQKDRNFNPTQDKK